MPVFNAQKTLKESIDSVLNQTHKNFKLYIINDCSTDSSKDIILSYIDSRIVYIENDINQGVSLSRNTGIKMCTGKYLSFLDSDDLWLPNKLALQFEKLESGYDVVCSNYFTFIENKIINTRVSPTSINLSDMLKTNYIGNLTGTYNCEKLGKVYQKNVGHEDYIMWLNILKKGPRVYCIQEPLAKYRLSENSVSGNKFKAMKWQWLIYRTELNFTAPKSIYYFLHYIFNAFKKRR
ncbi:glycosyltransferase [Providencia sp. wls1914]|nr:glycosyltransferase [Providencia sp. wls1914]